jgi:hypothetical protein
MRLSNLESFNSVNTSNTTISPQAWQKPALAVQNCFMILQIHSLLKPSARYHLHYFMLSFSFSPFSLNKPSHTLVWMIVQLKKSILNPVASKIFFAQFTHLHFRIVPNKI